MFHTNLGLFTFQTCGKNGYKVDSASVLEPKINFCSRMDKGWPNATLIRQFPNCARNFDNIDPYLRSPSASSGGVVECYGTVCLLNFGIGIVSLNVIQM